MNIKVVIDGEIIKTGPVILEQYTLKKLYDVSEAYKICQKSEF